MLTPQAIKDQEFQIKFRGYDAIEVKSYLELLAEDYFELHEQNRVLAEELEVLGQEQQSLQKEKEKLEDEFIAGQENSAEIKSEVQEESDLKAQEIEELKAQIEELNGVVTTLTNENKAYLEKNGELEEKLNSENSASEKDKNEIEQLAFKLELAEEKNRELQQEGLDFKTTILAAQKFADNLRETSEQDARLRMEQAKEEVEKFRKESADELAHLPRKIEELQLRKAQVRDELKKVLNSYMAKLDIFDGQEIDGKEDDLSDLFQSIQIPDGESVDPDDIDNINMELT